MAGIADPVASINGCWTWVQGPPAVWEPSTSTLYFGEIRTDGSISTWSYRDRGLYDFFLNGTPLTSILEQDDHDNPIPIVLDNNEIGLGYSPHSTGNAMFARTNGASQILSWRTPVTVNSGTNFSYCHLVQTTDAAKTLFYFYRDTLVRKYKTSTDRGDTWSAANSLISQESGGGRPYARYLQSPSDPNKIYVFMSQDGPGETLANCSLYACYLQVASDGSVTAHALGSGAITIPFKPSDCTLVYSDTGGKKGWMWGIAEVSGTPIFTFIHLESSNTKHYHHMAQWNGSTVVDEQIVEAGDGTADYLTSGLSSTAYALGNHAVPNDALSCYLGIWKNSNTDGKSEIEKWTRSGTFGGSGSWAKVSSISGVTNTVNARPFAINCGGTTKVIWWEGSYTTYLTFATSVRLYPTPKWKKAKVSSPSWQSTYAPNGVQAYYLGYEGSGSTVHDVSPNARDGTVNGSPTWHAAGAGEYGPWLDNFSTSNFIAINAIASAFSSNVTNYPLWDITLFRSNSTGTTAEVIWSFGRSSNNNPIIWRYLNNGTTTNLTVGNRDNSAVGPAYAGNQAGIFDGNYHVLLTRRNDATHFETWLDGVRLLVDSQTNGDITLDLGTIGCLRRTTNALPYSKKFDAMIIGWGATQSDPYWLTLDVYRGQFSGTFDPTVTTQSPTTTSVNQAVKRAATW